jgi:hypothetical protein
LIQSYGNPTETRELEESVAVGEPGRQAAAALRYVRYEHERAYHHIRTYLMALRDSRDGALTLLAESWSDGEPQEPAA